MKTILYTTTITFIILFTACTSVQELVDRGQYDDAIYLAVEKLAGQKKRKTKHVKALESAFEKVNKVEPGEILITSIDHDGIMKGYDIETINEISKISDVPIIASGGAGNLKDFYEIIERTNIKALSAASIFHFTETTPLDVKRYLDSKGIKVRI